LVYLSYQNILSSFKHAFSIIILLYMSAISNASVFCSIMCFDTMAINAMLNASMNLDDVKVFL